VLLLLGADGDDEDDGALDVDAVFELFRAVAEPECKTYGGWDENQGTDEDDDDGVDEAGTTIDGEGRGGNGFN